jgi:hypothetical protein
MQKAVLIHANKRYNVSPSKLIEKCDLFRRNVQLVVTAYTVKSAVSSCIFRRFIADIENGPSEVTGDDYLALRLLCDEFGFHELKETLRTFELTPAVLDVEEGDSCVRKILKTVLNQLQSMQQQLDELHKQVIFLPEIDSLIISEYPREILGDFAGGRFDLLWRGTRDGFGAATFHAKCNGRGNILTIVMDMNGYIFGGFTPIALDSSNATKQDSSNRSFLFTLKNPTGTNPMKFPMIPSKIAITCYANYGPYFGNSNDLYIADNCNQNLNNASNLGVNFTNNTGQPGHLFLTGANNFQVKEIEVFQIIQ